MKTKEIVLARDFSKFPSGRKREDGEFSGERFRKDFLIPALLEYDRVDIYLDGTLGYSSSFLDEAFGTLIVDGFRELDLVNKKLFLHSEKDPSLVLEAYSYLSNHTYTNNIVNY